jgi:hypothetical protein
MENNKKSCKVLFISIIISCIIIFIINITKPEELYYYNNKNKIIPIPFGYGRNKKILCVYSICLVSPLILYVFFSLLY